MDDTASHWDQAERSTASLQEAEGSRNPNSGSGQGSANRSNAFSSQCASTRNNDVSISSPVGREIPTVLDSAVYGVAPDNSNAEALELSDSRNEVAGNLDHQ